MLIKFNSLIQLVKVNTATYTKVVMVDIKPDYKCLASKLLTLLNQNVSHYKSDIRWKVVSSILITIHISFTVYRLGYESYI